MSSPRPDTPVLTFVGRPLDLNKGLASFLAAVEGLLDTPSAGPFEVWIIGGDEGETDALRRWVHASPALATLLASGGLRLWGVQPREALPDLYRRSWLTVMPSRREQFGLVAVEAMMCGCPVVACGLGGPSDTVLAGRTGSHVDTDDAEALRAAILFYLRQPAIRACMSQAARQWATFAFDISSAYAELAALYTPQEALDLREPIWSRQRDFARRLAQPAIDALERRLGPGVDKVEVVREDRHAVLCVTVAERRYALKVYGWAFSHTSVIFPLGRAAPARSPADLAHNALYHRANPVLPALDLADPELGFALFDWLDGEPALDLDLEGLRKVARSFGAHGQNHPSMADRRAVEQALTAFLATPDDLRNLEALDVAAMALNEHAQGSALGKRGVDPRVELARIQLVAREVGWPVPDDVAAMIVVAARLAGAHRGPEVADLRLHHGDLAPEDILRTAGGLRCLDTEHSIFANGELDVGVWLSRRVWTGGTPAEAVNQIMGSNMTRDERISALQWLVATLTARYLSQAYQGGLAEATRRARRVWSDLLVSLSGLIP